MGCSASEPIHIISNVDQQLLDAQEEEKYQHKILLLGAGESGKSTVVKQIKLIWKVGGGPSEKEKQEYILAIRRNSIEAIQTLLEVRTFFIWGTFSIRNFLLSSSFLLHPPVPWSVLFVVIFTAYITLQY